MTGGTCAPFLFFLIAQMCFLMYASKFFLSRFGLDASFPFAFDSDNDGIFVTKTPVRKELLLSLKDHTQCQNRHTRCKVISRSAAAETSSTTRSNKQSAEPRNDIHAKSTEHWPSEASEQDASTTVSLFRLVHLQKYEYSTSQCDARTRWNLLKKFNVEHTFAVRHE